MKKQVIVIGLGRFGISVATTLSNMGHDVLALDTNGTRVQSVASQITHAVQADATNETILRDLGSNNFNVAIIAMGSALESSVLSTILIKKLGVSYVIARADDELHGSILEKTTKVLIRRQRQYWHTKWSPSSVWVNPWGKGRKVGPWPLCKDSLRGRWASSRMMRLRIGLWLTSPFGRSVQAARPRPSRLKRCILRFAAG